MSKINKFIEEKGLSGDDADSFASYCEERYGSHSYLLFWDELKLYYSEWVQKHGNPGEPKQ